MTLEELILKKDDLIESMGEEKYYLILREAISKEGDESGENVCDCSCGCEAE